MEKVKIGFVGCGYMSQLVHLPCFISLDNCEVVALAARRGDRRGKVARKFNIPREYASHKKLAKDEDIKAVVTVLPPEINPRVTIDLAEAGKDMMIEKPMAISVKEAQKMVDAAKANGVKLMLAYMKRYDSGVERAKQFIDEVLSTGEMGDILYGVGHCFLGGNWTANIENLAKVIRTTELAEEPEDIDPGPEWLTGKLKEKMYTHDNAYYHFIHVHSHNINLLRYLLGDPLDISYAGMDGDVNLVILRYDGFPVTLEVGGPISHNGFDEETKIYFNHGWIKINTPPPLLRNVPAKVEIYRAGNKQEMSEVYTGWDWSFRRQAEHFIDCVLNDREPRSTGEDSLGDIKVVESIFKKYINIE